MHVTFFLHVLYLDVLRRQIELKLKIIFLMYGYNIGSPMGQSLCTLLLYFVITICPTSYADPTLTIYNLSIVMASIKDWYNLGQSDGGLCIPFAVRNEIRTSTAYQTEKEKKMALLLYYLHNVPTASWQSVAGALYFKEEVTVLQAVKVFLNTPAG